MYKGVGVRFADFISFFLKYPMEMKLFSLIETNLFQFHRIFKKRGGGGARRGSSEPPEPPLDPPLLQTRFYRSKHGLCLI